LRVKEKAFILKAKKLQTIRLIAEPPAFFPCRKKPPRNNQGIALLLKISLIS